MTLVARISAVWRTFVNGRSGLATPAVTNPQLLAVGQAVITVLVVLGFDLDASTQQLLIGLSAALGAALPVSDAVIRNGRAKNAKEVAAVSTEKPAVSGSASSAESKLLTDAQRDQIVERRAELAARRLPRSRTG